MVEKARDEALGQATSITSAQEVVEKKVIELQTANSQLGGLRERAETLRTKVNNLESKVAEVEGGEVESWPKAKILLKFLWKLPQPPSTIL